MADLADIQNKVRALVAAPSVTQLTDEQINNYVNTYYLYDFPQQLRVLKLQTVYNLYLEQGQNTYSVPWDSYMSFSQPCYIGEYETPLYMDRTTFYRAYPIFQQNQLIPGADTIGPYTVTLGMTPVTPGTVYVSASTTAGFEQSQDDTNGNFPSLGEGSTIDYYTGQITLYFKDPVSATNSITGMPNQISIQFNSQQWAWPQALLLYDSTFIVSPVPDQSYLLTLNAYFRPTALLSQTDVPLLPDWWQVLAFGAAKKILEERMDTDQLYKLLPMLHEQLIYLQRTTLVELSQQRPKTPYSWQLMYQQGNSSDGSWFWYS